YLPSRLIDVGSETEAPRLISSTDIQKPDSFSTIHYVTLNHCWGRRQILKLEGWNHEQLRRSISLERMPRTFQGAIEFTRRLRSQFGVRYLWIDSLCIFQDSVEDWQHESMLMAEVYGSSWCNLA
ncbi:HET-domain-containing protein, partial [Acephala macrosclerotiorum]